MEDPQDDHNSILRKTGRFLYLSVRFLLIVLSFPLSLVAVGYFNQQKARKKYFADDDNEETG